MTMRLIGWTLIHSLWQGGVIAALLGLAFAATRRSAASIRYWLGLAGLALMVILPAATAARMDAPATTREFSPTPLPIAKQGVVDATQSPPTPPAVSRTAINHVGPAPGGSPAMETTGRTNQGGGDPVTGVQLWTLDYVEAALPWVVAAWFVGLVILSLRMIGGISRTRRIARKGTAPAPDHLIQLVSRIADQLGLHRLITVLQGTEISVPIVVGWVRPVIVIPAGLISGLTPYQLDMLLAHELAHIKRYDFLANMLQTVIETLLFYHPAARWLSDRIREERENCCDDMAVTVGGGDRKAYTEALLALEESRDGALTFAAAATGGGSLLRRAMRLMTGGPAHLDLGARWIAGVITILAALLTTGPAMSRAEPSIRSRLDVIGFLGYDGDTITLDSKGAQNPALAAPDTLIRYVGSGAFGERWQWAEQRARSLRSREFWVGYLVAGDATGQRMSYSDRTSPVSTAGGVFFGRSHFGGSINGLHFSGVPLAPLVGNHAPTSTAIFLQFEKDAGGARLERVHVGSFSFPVYFDRLPAIWLDSAGDLESVALLRRLVAETRALEPRRDLIGAVGAHRDADVVLPVLIGWLTARNELPAIRREAAEALGDHPDRRAVAALAGVARTDNDDAVRQEAIEAFEGMKLDAAADTLMALTTSLDSYKLRHVALESLGSRGEPRVARFLINLAQGNAETRLRLDAIEALGSMPDDVGFEALRSLARGAADVQVRHKAVEEIGDSEATDKALAVLADVVRNDPSEEVRMTAVEAIAEAHDARAVAILRDLAVRSPDPNIQVKATEALGDAAETSGAVAALITLARTHPLGEVRRKAVETLGEVHEEPAAGAALMEFARADADPDVRRAAVEALGGLHTGASLDALRSIARTSGPAAARRQAMETYAENVSPETAVAFLKSIVLGDPDAGIRLQALEILSEVEGSSVSTAIRELARSSPDARVRSYALEILSER